MRVVDAHLHLWDPELFDYDWLEGPLAARFGPGERRRAGVAVEGSVFVQAECVPESYESEVRWVSELAADPESGLSVRGIVAGCHLDRGEDTVRQLDALQRYPLVVGVRHLLQSQPSGFMSHPAFCDGLAELVDRGLSFDACIRHDQLSELAAVANRFPRLRVVLDHLGKPPVGDAASPLLPNPRWIADMQELSENPAVFCKLSGLPAEAGGRWAAAQLWSFLDTAASSFGADRLMWGSDWPVSGVEPTAFARWLATVNDWALDRGHDAEAIMSRNTERFYQLETGRSRNAAIPPSTSMNVPLVDPAAGLTR